MRRLVFLLVLTLCCLHTSMLRAQNWGTWSNYKGEPNSTRAPSRYRAPSGRSNLYSNPPAWLVRCNGATGSLIDVGPGYGIVLTAYHVVSSGKSVTGPDGSKRVEVSICYPWSAGTYAGCTKGYVVPPVPRARQELPDGRQNAAVDRAGDLAFVVVPRTGVKPASTARRLPSRNESVYILGYGGGDYRSRQGRMLSLSDHGLGGAPTPLGDVIKVTPGAIGGDSGGAILNANGELCGVVSRANRGYTLCGSNQALERLAADGDFDFPWQLPWRRHVEGELDDLNQQLQAIGLPQIEREQGISEHQIEVLLRIGERINALEARQAVDLEPLNERISDVDARTSELESIVESVKAVAEKGETELQQRLATLVGDVKTAKDMADVAESTAQSARIGADVAIEESSNATDAALGAVGQAKTLVTTAIEDAEPGLLDRLRSRLEETIVGKALAGAKDLVGDKIAAVTGTLGWLKNAVFGSYAGLGILAIALWWTYSDIKKFIQTGGENRLTVQHVADRTRNTYDDAAADALAGLVRRAAQRMGRWPTPEAEGTQPGTTPEPTEQGG